MKSGIMLNADLRVKNAIKAKKYILGILLHAVMKIETNQQVLWMIQRLHVMKLYNKQKTLQ